MPECERDEETVTRTLSVGRYVECGTLSSVGCPLCPSSLHAIRCGVCGSPRDYYSSGTDKSGHDWSPADKAWGIKFPFKQSRADDLKATQHSVTTFGGSNATSACNRIVEDGVIVASTTGDSHAGSLRLASSCQLQSRDLPSRRILGKGLSGIGYETTWNGERFARKDFIGVPRDVFEEEAAVLVGLKDHRNVVKTHGWTADKRSCSLVLDLMDDDLLSLLQKISAIEQDLAGVCSGGQSSTSTARQPFDNLSEALDTMLQIARGMENLHEQGVAHGDLKTKNILVTNGDQTLKLVKVTDFGLVRTKRKSKSNVSRQVRKLDIVKWKAPEYLGILFRQLISSNNEEGSTSSESDSKSESEESSSPLVLNVKLRRPDVFAADVYSFAVTCAQILTAKDPYPDLDWKDLGVKILSGLRPILPDACPPLLRSLLMSCWGDPAQRPTFSEIRMGLEYYNALLPTDFPVDTVVEKPTEIIPSLEPTKSDDINRGLNLGSNSGSSKIPCEGLYGSSATTSATYPSLSFPGSNLRTSGHAVSFLEKDENEKKRVEHERRDYESASESSCISTMELQPSSVGRPWSRQAYERGEPLSRQMPHECTTGDTFSSLNSSISFPSSSPKPNSDSSLLHSLYSPLPRALSLPSLLYDISINSLNHTGAIGPLQTATLIASMDGPGGHSFSAPESFAAAMPLSPNAPVTGKCYARSPMVGNSMSGGQHSLGNTYSVHETSLVMEEGSAAMQGSLSSSPSSVHAPSNNIPSLTSGFHHPEDDKEVGQRSILVRSLSSLVSTDFQNQPLKSPSVMSGDYLLQRQRSWTGGRVASRWNRAGPDNRSPEVPGYWKSETMNNRTGCALSPLSSIPGSNPSCPQHASSSFQQAGVERKLEDVKLDTGQVEGGVIPEGGLAIVNLLLRAAEAVDIGNAEMAKAILARLNQHISPTREKSIHRVAHYFREALVTRLLGAENFVAQLSQDRTLSPLEEFHKINAYVRFCEVSPYRKFAHFTANQAILEALDGEEAMHIIDFQMGAGAQWASFLQDIASLKAAGKVISKVRLTAVGTRADEIRATGANLCNFARMMNIALEFQAVVTRPECLDVSMLGLRDNEAVAGNFIFSLHELLDGETCNGLSTVLKSVLQARPKVVTTVEQEANHSGPFFQQRFSEALQYYMFLFDSLTSSLEAGADSSVNSSIESCLLAPEIMNIVACDGVARVERHERLAQWRVRMLAVGFSPRPLSVASQVQAERLVTQISARGGFQVIRDQGGLLLGWQGRPLLAASSWIC